MIINETQIDNLDIQALSVVPTKTLIRKFGKVEDNVELSVYDLNGNLLLNKEDFTGYKPSDQIVDRDGLYNEINIDYTQTLKDLGFTSGKYNLVLGFYRKAIVNSFVKPFYISDISPSRREIKIKSDVLSDGDMINGFNQLIGVLESSAYFREFILNFDKNIQATAINFQIDTIVEPTEVLIKLFDPLPNNISVKSKFRLAEEIINPISVIIDLGEPTLDQLIVGEEIKGPNLRIDTRLNSSKPSVFRTYDQILGGSISSSFSNINNYLSSSLELAIDFTDTDNETGFHFENFVHFSSAVERLKNFRYKLQLLESYDSEIVDIDTLEGDQTSSIVVISERDRIEKKKQTLIGSFDPYERFLYYESGTYAWPKTNSSKPYNLYPVSSNESKLWIGSEDYTSGYYGGQLLSASAYDEVNIHRLTDTLPEHIVSNPDNSQYVLFVDMVAEHFDKIWLYIDHITNINKADSKLSRGISKNMVYEVLKNAGVKVFDQFENENLFSYITADVGANGSFQYQAPTSQSMVSASNAGSIPKGDITKEVWKRIHDNLPYLLKTKGTERGMKALMSCYGVPETILHIKEYGGPTADKTGFRIFSYPKYSKVLRISPFGDSSSNGYIRINEDNVRDDVKTIQFRFKPDYDSNIPGVQTVFGNYNNNSPEDSFIPFRVIIKETQNNYLDDKTFGYIALCSGSITLASTEDIPIYNGDMWNFTLLLDSGSTNNITLYCTNTSYNKNTYITSCSANFENYFSTWGLNAKNKSLAWGASLNNGLSNYPLGGATEGNIQEVRLWTERLDENIIASQSLSPFNYNGNTISSSFESLYLRVPLGSNLFHTESAYTSNDCPNPSYRALYSAIISNDITTLNVEYVSLNETHYLPTPDTVGKSMVSDKVRLDTGTIDSDILSPFVRSEESTQDRQPNDFSDLGVFFSPTFEVNEDIIYTLGGFRMDDYIGDPRHYTASEYPDLESLRKIYTQKVSNRIVNIWDYLKLIQQFDHTLFKMIEQFAPAKANLKTGLVIEPHYLNRPKLNGLHITTDPTSYELELGQINPPISSEYTLNEVGINIYNYIVSGSGGTATENVAQNGRLSSKYFILP